jgi:glycosyltransferase involved in cell wall biosynthesis
MAFLEAQAAGLPVVAGRAGGVADVIADGETGFLVAPGNPDAFADAVAALLDAPAIRLALGAAAPRRVARHHDIGAAAGILKSTLKRFDKPDGADG